MPERMKNLVLCCLSLLLQPPYSSYWSSEEQHSVPHKLWPLYHLEGLETLASSASSRLKRSVIDWFTFNFEWGYSSGKCLTVNLPFTLPFLLLLFFLVWFFDLLRGQRDHHELFHLVVILWGPETNWEWLVGHEHVCKWSLQVEFTCELTSFFFFFLSSVFFCHTHSLNNILLIYVTQ